MPDGRGLILVVGPSGVGKDAIIAATRAQLIDEGRVHFVRRIITRAAAAGSEDHESCEPDVFHQRVAQGDFGLHWQANGLQYGLPVAFEHALDGVVVANVSRSILPEARERYPGLLVCSIEASPHVLRHRLLARAREDHAGIESRLARAARFDVNGEDVVAISNDGPLTEAVEHLVAVIRERLERQTERDGPST